MTAMDKCNKDYLDGTAAHSNCVKEVEHEYRNKAEALKEQKAARKVVRNSKSMRRHNRR
jgi:hypothetical protein